MNKDYFFKRLAITKPSALESYNYDLLPETFSAHDKIPIECYKHGIFYQTVCSHLHSQGCPKCGELVCRDKIALTTEEFVSKSKARFGDKYDYTKTNYSRRDVELIITCPTHGDIVLTPLRHSWSKHGCPQCDFEIPRAIKMQKVIEKAKKIHGDKYDYSRINFINGNDKVEIICPNHGSFYQSLCRHTLGGNGCPKCATDSDRLTTDSFIIKSKVIHGDQYDYSKVDYKTNVSMVIITCKKHGDFIQRAASHLAGCKCKKCFQDEYRLSAEEFIKNAKEVHGDSYDYSKVNYHGNKKQVEIICPNHGSFWVKPNSHVSSRTGCRLCMESKGEKAVEVFLKKHGINYIREYRLIPHLYRCDFYLPEFNIFIEFNGLQHYKPIEIFGGQNGYLSTKERDEIKKSIIKQNNGNLIIITYLNLKDNSVEKEMIRRLKTICARWYTIDGKLMVFKTINDVYSYFNIHSSVLIRNLDLEVKKVVKDFKVLF